MIQDDPAVLLIEDNKTDATLIKELLTEKSDQFQVDVVVTLAKGLEILSHNNYDIVILDLNLPDSSGIESYFKIQELENHIPVLILTATDDEEIAIEAVKSGAQDYLIKWEFNAGALQRALLYGIERCQLLAERNELIAGLKQALKEVRELRELLSVCAHCKKIRDDSGVWQQVDVYLQTHTDIDISHSLCPECITELYPHMNKKNKLQE